MEDLGLLLAFVGVRVAGERTEGGSKTKEERAALRKCDLIVNEFTDSLVIFITTECFQ